MVLFESADPPVGGSLGVGVVKAAFSEGDISSDDVRRVFGGLLVSFVPESESFSLEETVRDSSSPRLPCSA